MAGDDSFFGIHDIRKFTAATSTVTTVLTEAIGVLGCPGFTGKTVEGDDCPEYALGPVRIGEGAMFVAASSKIFIFGGVPKGGTLDS